MGHRGRVSPSLIIVLAGPQTGFMSREVGSFIKVGGRWGGPGGSDWCMNECHNGGRFHHQVFFFLSLFESHLALRSCDHSTHIPHKNPPPTAPRELVCKSDRCFIFYVQIRLLIGNFLHPAGKKRKIERKACLSSAAVLNMQMVTVSSPGIFSFPFLSRLQYNFGVNGILFVALMGL